MILLACGCQTTARNATQAAFDAGRQRLEAWWADKKPVVIAEAKETALALANQAKDAAQAYAAEKIDGKVAEATARLEARGVNPANLTSAGAITAEIAKTAASGKLDKDTLFDFLIVLAGVVSGGLLKGGYRAVTGDAVRVDPSSLPTHLQAPPTT